ncbi:MAG: ClpXP protease specificity-enhancing factor, partial [Alcaligenaceae bacterium]|nr:ClpXP protease specificity-enhancing factor [Alcaligenaceae bacterium]
MQETSTTKPYLLRALHEWCLDNGYTPYIVVTVDANTVVPVAHIHDGQITLNINPLATNRLIIGNDYIEFEARFSGVTEQIFVPVAAVSAIYARETGTGMGFEVIESQPYPGGGDTDVSRK